VSEAAVDFWILVLSLAGGALVILAIVALYLRWVPF
jgi:hypothetical protein